MKQKSIFRLSSVLLVILISIFSSCGGSVTEGSSLLKSLTPDYGELVPQFSPEVYLYRLDVESHVQELNIDFATQWSGAVVFAADSEGNPIEFPLVLNGDSMSITLKVVREGAGARVYTINIHRLLSSDSSLNRLEFTDGFLESAFVFDTYNYSLILPAGTDRIGWSSQTSHPLAKVEVLDEGGQPAALPLLFEGGTAGAGTDLSFKVTAEDGTTSNYTVRCIDAGSRPDAAWLSGLSGRTGEVGNLQPGFHPLTLGYSAAADQSVANLSFSATLYSPAATVTVVDQLSQTLPVTQAGSLCTFQYSPASDMSELTLTVTAVDGVTTLNYKLALNRRALHTDNLLASMVPEIGRLEPGFSPAVQDYFLGVPSTTKLLSLNCTAADSYAAVSISPHPVDLSVSDEQQVAVSVTAENGDVRIYRLTVRKNSSDSLKLKFTEVGSAPSSQASRWFELKNESASALSLTDYSFRALGMQVSSLSPLPEMRFELRLAGGADYDAQMNQMLLAPGQRALIHFLPVLRDQNGNLTAMVLPSGPQNYYIAEYNGAVPFWGDSGFLELIKYEETIDFVRFGNESEQPLTASAWSGGVSPALPSTSFSDFGKSLGRDRADSDSNRGQDWILSEWATPGGLNDVTDGTDADGDGIPDANEQAGQTFAGLPLYDWGARINQKDLFIHLDYMNNATAPSSGAEGVQPHQSALEKVQAAFAASGYRLHIDAGTLFGSAFNMSGKSHEVPYAATVDLGTATNPAADLYRVKAGSMPIARKNIFHYCLFGSIQPGNGSSGKAECPGNDILITLQDFDLTTSDSTGFPVLGWSAAENTNKLINYQAATLMHEFGHNLGLHHGGFNPVGGEYANMTPAQKEARSNYKPNYISVMNYLYQMRGLPAVNNAAEGDRYYYQQRVWQQAPFKGISSDEDLHHNCYSSDFRIDFSREVLPSLTESSLNEPAGLRGGPHGVDWDGNGTLSGALSVDLNNDGANTTLVGHHDWGAVNPVFQREFWSDAHGSARSVSEKTNHAVHPAFMDYFNVLPPCTGLE